MARFASTPVQKFGDVFSGGGLKRQSGRFCGPSEEASQVVARELPFEGASDQLVVVLEAEDTSRDGFARGEVGGREGFALKDREVDLDLIEPAGVLGQMDEGEVGEAASRRSTAAWPRRIVPPSTIQKTRRAER